MEISFKLNTQELSKKSNFPAQSLKLNVSMQIYEMQCKTKTQFANMQDKQFFMSKLNNLDFIFSKKEFYSARVKLL